MPAIFSTSDRDELRRRLMDAGWRCLLERGYRGTRIEGVVRELAGPAADGDRRDLGLAAALQRSLAVVLLSRDEFEPGVLERVVDALIDDTLDALYGPADAKGDDAR